MRRYAFILKTVLLGALFLSAKNPNNLPPPQSPTPSIYFGMRELTCLKTTEQSEDEVYFIVTYRYGVGGSGQYTLGPFNINDGNEPRKIGGFNLFQGDLPFGQYVDLTILVMEQDNGGSAQVIQKAQTVINFATPIACEAFPPSCPYAAAVAGVINAAAALPETLRGIVNDSDDYIGSINVRIRNDNGMLSAYYYNADRCANYGPPAVDPWAYLNVVANFVGDGSWYNFYGIASFRQ